MRYVDFRDAIADELRRFPAGLTWAELKQRLKLPYKIPCPEWVRQLEQEIGLSRERGSGRALIWKVGTASATASVRHLSRPVGHPSGLDATESA
ncbi:MAG: hypothetical protein ACHRHE_16430 [Tepidisphaerales bacterium]